MVFQIPPFLKSGDCIGIAATARWVSAEQLQPAIDRFTSWGLRVKVASNVLNPNFQLAGTAEERTFGLQELLDDDDVQAVIIARGGYGTVHTIDMLDFSRFEKKPKWIAGYSDITVLHAHLNSRGIATIHSTMPISFPDATEVAIDNLRRSLFGELSEFTSTEMAQVAEVSGCVLGGNLSVLYSLIGSDSWRKTADVILFIEDVDEMLYHLDRMLWGMYRAGMLSTVKAIVCGGFTQMKDNTKHFGFQVDNPFGGDALDMIRRVGEAYGIPVISGFPAGHQSDNRAFYIGRSVTITARDGSAVMSWS